MQKDSVSLSFFLVFVFTTDRLFYCILFSQGKVEDLQNLLKKKEKEYEDTMDHLQADIESLETEKGELKDKLKNMNKKVLFDNVVKTAAGMYIIHLRV